MKSLLLFLILAPITSLATDFAPIKEHQHLDIIDESKLNDALENGIWNEEKSAFAFCVSGAESSCYVYHNTKLIDVSGVEGRNIGKLGIAPRNSYEKFITHPALWIEREDGLLMIKFTTQAWKNGQRYSVHEPMVIKNGKPIYR
ncbi:MAG: hypothetical protein GY875_23160 [Gammaproteobacteria bacterium]|nr:hypothetical protein [Gammaproteobacteria bacterium]